MDRGVAPRTCPRRWRRRTGRRRRAASPWSWAVGTCRRSGRSTRSTSSSSTARPSCSSSTRSWRTSPTSPPPRSPRSSSEGVLRIVTGDAVQGAHLARHPGVDTLHITGSDRTYDAIVFGTGPEGEARRAARRALLAKPFTAELGNLTPIVVVPGRWTERSSTTTPRTSRRCSTNNAGFNCTTSRVIVTAGGWSQREALLDRLRRRLAQLPCRFAFYPGAAARFAAFREAHPAGELFGSAGDGHLPWMLIPASRPTRRTTPPTGSRRSAASWPRRRSTPPTPRSSSTGRWRSRTSGSGDAQRHGHRRPAHRPRPGGGAGPRPGARPAPVRDRGAQHTGPPRASGWHHAVGRGARATRGRRSARGRASSTTR